MEHLHLCFYVLGLLWTPEAALEHRTTQQEVLLIRPLCVQQLHKEQMLFPPCHLRHMTPCGCTEVVTWCERQPHRNTTERRFVPELIPNVDHCEL